MAQITDPVEKIVAGVLDHRGIRYVHEHKGLDFYLPDQDIYIECKQFHTDRSNGQLKRAENIILIQGIRAAEVFSVLISRLETDYG